MSHRKSRYFALSICCLLALPACAECVLPHPPSRVPDANTATEQEMLTAMQTLKRYAGDVMSYTKCLQFEVNQNRLTNDDQQHLHNAAIDELHAVTAKFNEQVRLFKERHPS